MSVSVRNAMLLAIGLITVIVVVTHLLRPANVAKAKANEHDDHGGAIELSDTKIAAAGIELVSVGCTGRFANHL